MKPRFAATVSAVALLIALCPARAHAMHLAEGILPVGWAGLWFLVAAPFALWGVHVVNRRRAADPRSMAMIALVGSAIFVISCMPVPIPWVGTCSHPCGTGLGAILIGPGPTIVVAAIALLFQALLLAHGGLTTLGADIVSMGVMGALSASATFGLLRRCGTPVLAAAIVAGMVSDWATYATTAFQLASALHGDGSLAAMFAAVVVAFVPTQLPLGILEGILTGMAYRFILIRRPELLGPPPQLEMALGEEA